MNEKAVHSWNVDQAEAQKIQEKLKRQLQSCSFTHNKFITGGIDVSFKKNPPEASAAIVILEYPRLQILEVSIARTPVKFPYISGFLAFREGPVIVKAWEKLRTKPDLLIFDSQGLAHPRQIGIACHLGILLDCPSIGVGKSRLYGDFVEPAKHKGAYSYLTDPVTGEKIGALLRTRANVKCIFVSPGHRMNINSSIKTIFSLVRRYRLPEPIRYAHHYAGKGWD